MHRVQPRTLNLNSLGVRSLGHRTFESLGLGIVADGVLGLGRSGFRVDT